MQKLIILPMLAILLLSCGGNPDAGKEGNEGHVDPEITIAIPSPGTLGADEYGMKQYVMAFLYRGAATGIDSMRAAELQNAHLENITRLAEEGLLVVAGPFLDAGELRGIYIFDTPDLAEAEKYTLTDPAIREGLLRMELKPWYGSAALKMVNAIHESIAVSSITGE